MEARVARPRNGSGHAVVIGGSMAGLLSARSLSERFEQVTLLERDPMPDGPAARKGQPHARHAHAVLGAGLDHLKRAFPDLIDAIRDGGAVVVDAAETMRWFTDGGYRRPLRAGFDGALLTRPFLEHLVRARVRALPNVEVVDRCAADALVTDAAGDRLVGAQVTDRATDTARTIVADLVVDASGRGSATPRWMEAIGYTGPSEDEISVNLGYATRLYERDPNAADASTWYFTSPTAPHDKRGGVAFPVEGNGWLVMLSGLLGDHPPGDEAGFVDFARSLAAPDVASVMARSTPVSDIVLHKFPSSRRRRYERLGRVPAGLVVVGDGIASFNPIYGQGMTSAAFQAAALGDLLDQGHTPETVSKPYFSAASRIVDRFWQLAAGEDFRFPETTGRKAPGTDLLNAYVARVHRATHHDPVVCASFLKVMHMLAPPTMLFHPRVVGRVLRGARAPAA